MPAPTPRPIARAVAARVPSPASLLAAAARVAPTPRSFAMGVAIFAACVLGYVGARFTSVFAVDRIEVRGASPSVANQVRDALARERGRSLLAVDGAAVARRLAPVSAVRSSSVDRAFPHTLVVTVQPERPVAVVRQGADAWLVSVRGRVIRRLAPHTSLALPRLWIPKGAAIAAGDTLAGGGVDAGLAALAPLRGTVFARRVATVKTATDELALVLRSGLELRLGDASDLRLKLAVAARVLAAAPPPPSGGYVDVSVPERPVASDNPKVGG